MEDINEIKFEPLAQSQYVVPIKMHYTQNGRKKIWDMIKLHESVAVVLFHTEKKNLIFVKQFRPAVYYNHMRQGDSDSSKLDYKIPISKGITLELCAGIVDKEDDLVGIAQSEIVEECGYKVPRSQIEQILSFRGGVGVSGEQQTLFYAEVNDGMKVSNGGGLASEGELIDVVEVSIPDLKKMLKQPKLNTTGGFLFGVTWFLLNKASQYS